MLAVVVLLHLGLLWLLINSTGRFQMVRNVSTLVKLIEPEKIKLKLGAALKSPVITPLVLTLPHIALPKIVVEVVKPTPEAPPAPAPVAAETGASASTLGDRTPAPALPPDDFTAYEKLVHDRLQATLDQISSERFIPGFGTVRLEMEIDRSGKILLCELDGADHPKWLVLIVTSMIQRNDPLPPFPAKIRAKHVGFAIPVTIDQSGPPGF